MLVRQFTMMVAMIEGTLLLGKTESRLRICMNRLATILTD